MEEGNRKITKMENGHISAFLQFTPQTKSKVEYSYQDLGLEMQSWFPEKERGFMWSLFYKYSESRIRDAWKAIQRTDVHSVRYLIGIIKKN